MLSGDKLPHFSRSLGIFRNRSLFHDISILYDLLFQFRFNPITRRLRMWASSWQWLLWEWRICFRIRPRLAGAVQCFPPVLLIWGVCVRLQIKVDWLNSEKGNYWFPNAGMGNGPFHVISVVYWCCWGCCYGVLQHHVGQKQLDWVVEMLELLFITLTGSGVS